MKRFASCALWLANIVGLLVLLTISNDGHASDWVHTATANGSDRWREQVILFRHEIVNGRRINRADPYLPRLELDAEVARRLNYERCWIALEQRQASGQVKRLRYDDPRTLFALELDDQRWREEPDTTVLEEVACVFTAGDARRQIQFPVFDERGALIGRWRWSQWKPVEAR
jgi:hypothetical protein